MPWKCAIGDVCLENIRCKQEFWHPPSQKKNGTNCQKMLSHQVPSEHRHISFLSCFLWARKLALSNVGDLAMTEFVVEVHEPLVQHSALGPAYYVSGCWCSCTSWTSLTSASASSRCSRMLQLSGEDSVGCKITHFIRLEAHHLMILVPCMDKEQGEGKDKTLSDSTLQRMKS